MGQLLSVPMIVIGLAFFIYAYRRTDGKVSW
jgi:prolipoprotein diacylglyceryltransferase